MRLKRLEVEGLFRVYDHVVDLAWEDRVTILYGINGIGKTTILRLLDALYQRQWGALGSVPYTSLLLVFADDTDKTEFVRVRPVPDPAGQVSGKADYKARTLQVAWGALREDIAGVPQDGRTADDPRLRVYEYGELSLPNPEVDAAEVDQHIRRIEPAWRQQGSMWSNEDTGEILSLGDLVARYSLWSLLSREPPRDALPWLASIIRPGSSVLLGTERLATSAIPGTSRGVAGLPSFAVDDCSERIKKHISEARSQYVHATLEAYFSTAEELLSAAIEDSEPPPDKRALLELLSGLERKRWHYAQLGLLDPITELRTGAYQQAMESPLVLRILKGFVDNALAKLEPLDRVAMRMALLEHMLNEKLSATQKKARVTSEGLTINTRDGLELPLRLLSSGEQHEVVMGFFLHFGLQPGTLLLIDEPENSLHILWQRQVVGELVSAAHASDVDIIVATHSPNIPYDRPDLLRSLDNEEQENAGSDQS